MKATVQRDATRLSSGVVLLGCFFFWLKNSRSELLSPVPKSPAYSQPVVYAAEISPIASPTHTPTSSPAPETKTTDDSQSKDVKSIVQQVFGSHADKAFKLLTCENGSLNPKATNHNRDKVGNEGFLFDPEINIHIAWRIYQDDGYSFKLWTCGKKFGI